MAELQDGVGSDNRAASQEEHLQEAPGTASIHRTWELELLISGAIVVALFKLPAVVDGLFDQLAPHV
jgi:hypothetical protein